MGRESHSGLGVDPGEDVGRKSEVIFVADDVSVGLRLSDSSKHMAQRAETGCTINGVNHTSSLSKSSATKAPSIKAF